MAKLAKYFGIYRKIWSSAIRGRRINSVSIMAECCFWRAHMVADDYGVFPADPNQFIFTAMPKRHKEVCAVQIAEWIKELKDADLINVYKSEGELMAEIVDFTELQAAGPNGKRISKFPLPPDLVNPDESKTILKNPKKSKIIPPLHKQEQEQEQEQEQTQGEAAAVSDDDRDWKNMVKAIESRLAQSIPVGEIDRLKRIVVDVDQTPLVVDGETKTTVETVLAAIGQIGPDVRNWPRYLSSIINNHRNSGTFPGDKKSPAKPSSNGVDIAAITRRASEARKADLK